MRTRTGLKVGNPIFRVGTTWYVQAVTHGVGRGGGIAETLTMKMRNSKKLNAYTALQPFP